MIIMPKHLCCREVHSSPFSGSKGLLALSIYIYKVKLNIHKRSLIKKYCCMFFSEILPIFVDSLGQKKRFMCSTKLMLYFSSILKSF